jgi:hypothetical protein
MQHDTPPVKVASTDQLGPASEARRPLPKAGPVCFADAHSILTYTVPAVGRHLPGVLDVGLWTSDQMRAYADTAAAAERERCSKVCHEYAAQTAITDFQRHTAKQLAAAIEGPNAKLTGDPLAGRPVE